MMQFRFLMGHFVRKSVILDTPCSAGARSDGLRPCPQDVSHRCHNVRTRQFEKNSQEVPYQGASGGLLNWCVFQSFIQKHNFDG